jgi:hypothetical protein
MGLTIRLPVVANPAKERRTPLVDPPTGRGNDAESLVCGACGGVIARNISTRSVFRRWSSASGRVFVKCRCGACCAINVVKIEGHSRA